MAGKAAIVLGNSHLSSVVLQLKDRPGEVYGGDESLQYFVFDTVRMGANFQFSVDSGGGNYRINPEILGLVNSRVPEGLERIYISMFGGNAHNALTLLEHPRPFDFILPERPNLPVEPGRELVTSSYINAFLNKMAAVAVLNMAALRHSVSEAIYHFESPPPVGDNRFIMDNLEGYFIEQSNNPQIAPIYLRYKLWRMHSILISGFCAQAGIEFLPSPAESLDAAGFMKSEHARDSTHAGASYGGLILKDLERRLGSKYGGWQWL
ncbi:hypothetical protein [Ensifer sp. R-19]|uniref:hypothetical protein n=1 Tax=Ensifer sp. R-19 TaxID=3404055 RepID=UPI003CF83052